MNPAFNFKIGMNQFGIKLIEAFNRQIIQAKLLPVGTLKVMRREPTPWGDYEVRFKIINGGEFAAREFRVRERKDQQFFEVRFVNALTAEFASRFYVMGEKDIAIEHMSEYLTSGALSTDPTTGAMAYHKWLTEFDEPIANKQPPKKTSYTPLLNKIMQGGFCQGDVGLFHENHQSV